MHNLFRLIGRFCKDKRGNIAVTFVIASLPIMSAIGCAVDYSLATRMKAKMQSAADAASVAAISKNSPGFIAAAAMTGTGSVTAAVTDAQNIFDGDINGVTGYQNLTRLATVTKTGVRLTSSVTFSADVPTTFMRVIGASYQKLTVTGSSNSSASLPPYIDFYLMLDVSGSMGLPSTNAEQTRLSAINPDDFSVYPNGCTFACHFQASGGCASPSVGQRTNPSGSVNSAYPTNGYCLGYAISRLSQSGYAGLLQTTTNYPMKGVQLPSAILANLNASLVPGTPNSLVTGNTRSQPNSLTPVTSCPTAGTDACIQLRADAVGFALNATLAQNGVDGLFATANKKETVTNQFRIGLYPFIRNLITYSALTSNINASPTTSGTINYAAANLATLLDTGNTPDLGLGSGGTHFENAFPSMSNIITTVGDGSSPTNTQPYVFLVTDGAQNFQTCCGFSGSNSATVMPSGASSLCTPLKNRGITIAVLYIPYQTIQNPTTIFSNEDGVANANIANIPPSLTNCASPGFFYQANTPADITTALNAMFTHAVQTAHLTN
jgi:Flp pilus assembly protein TadG